MNNDPIDDAMSDLTDAIAEFRNTPNEDTLDNVYRMTSEIERQCRNAIPPKPENRKAQ